VSGAGRMREGTHFPAPFAFGAISAHSAVFPLPYMEGSTAIAVRIVKRVQWQVARVSGRAMDRRRPPGARLSQQC